MLLLFSFFESITGLIFLFLSITGLILGTKLNTTLQHSPFANGRPKSLVPNPFVDCLNHGTTLFYSIFTLFYIDLLKNNLFFYPLFPFINCYLLFYIVFTFKNYWLLQFSMIQSFRHYFLTPLIMTIDDRLLISLESSMLEEDVFHLESVYEKAFKNVCSYVSDNPNSFYLL